jgi:hypothetical protein
VLIQDQGSTDLAGHSHMQIQISYLDSPPRIELLLHSYSSSRGELKIDRCELVHRAGVAPTMGARQMLF